jgi:hypothetical protein
VLRPAPRFSLHEDEALAMLDELWGEIHATVDDGALLVPERQRLLILRWISAARAVQDQASTRVVQTRVHAVAQELGRLGRTWWPGSVPALQLNAEPSQCRAALEVDADLRTWADVAAAAAERLERMAETDEARGQGELGWSDDASLQPPCAEPEAELKSIVRKLEELTGPLDGPPSFAADAGAVHEVLAELRPRAEKLRWLRGAVEDTWTWGAAMGRLRWVTRQIGGRTPLHEVLDPSFTPLRTWAQRLGYDPQKKERTRQKNQILKSFPGGNGRLEREDLLAWLRGALDCELISGDRLAEILEPHRELLGDLGPEVVPGLERRHRKKLRKVQERLNGEAAPAGADGLQEPGEPLEEEADAAHAPAAGVRTLDDRLLSEVRSRTHGKRALLVTNRADPELVRSLEDTFGFSTLEHCDNADRRIQSAAKRIQSGSYDFVLSATGFQSHKVDDKLRRSSVDADVPYVRVNRARRQACLRALAREFGLLQRHGL